MEDFKDIVKDLGNLEMKDSEEPRELPYNSIDLTDYSVEPMNTEEVKELWRQGKEFIAKEHTQIIVQAQVHRVDDAERPSSLETLVEKTGPDATLLTPSTPVEVIAEESAHSDSLNFVKAEIYANEGLKIEFNSGIIPTDEVRGRIYLAVEIGSVTLDALYDPGYIIH